MEVTRTIPTVIETVIKRVSIPILKASLKLFCTRFDIVKYIPLPGTNGIRAGINITVAVVLIFLEIISEYIVIAIEDIKNENTDEWFCLKKRYMNHPKTPAIPLYINLFDRRLKIIQKNIVAKNA